MRSPATANPRPKSPVLPIWANATCAHTTAGTEAKNDKVNATRARVLERPLGGTGSCAGRAVALRRDITTPKPTPAKIITRIMMSRCVHAGSVAER